MDRWIDRDILEERKRMKVEALQLEIIHYDFSLLGHVEKECDDVGPLFEQLGFLALTSDGGFAVFFVLRHWHEVWRHDHR